LNERARAASSNKGKSNLKAPARSSWTSCCIDLTQLDFQSLDSPLAMISPDDFAENATGVVMLSRAMFSSVCKVRSKHALLVVLPGANNSDLPGLGLAESSFAAHWMFLRDPLHSNWTRRLVTLVQMGAMPVLPHQLDTCPAWDVDSHLEFSCLLTRRMFPTDDAWSAFVSTSRADVVSAVRSLHPSFTPATVEFYSWTKLDASSQKVTFRAPSAHKNLLLAASGVHVPFVINLVCRDASSREKRDAACSVVWLGKLGYTESLTLIKQLDGHLGLALSQQSFGIRCVPASLDAVRRLVLPQDSKYTDSNIKIRGMLRFVISGLPVGCSRPEIIRRFAEWKVGDTTGWPIIPIKQWTSSGQSHWLVRADIAPPLHFYLCSSSRVLIQPAPPEQFAPKSRSSSVPRAKSKSQPKPKASPAPSAPSPALVSRVLAVENRLDLLEARSSSIESQLQSGFSQILARLDDRSSSSRRPAEDHTGATPPPKLPRPSAQAVATPALPNKST
jgi:hypothetical protein